MQLSKRKCGELAATPQEARQAKKQTKQKPNKMRTFAA
jgi:hypothetical protein